MCMALDPPTSQNTITKPKQILIVKTIVNQINI